MKLRCGAKSLDLSRPRIMGVLNVTPDSFSDGGQFDNLEKAIAHAHHLHSEGADIIDVGGESTRPGSSPISVQQEMDRVIPAIEKIAGEMDVIISVDTSTPDVMLAAVNAGAGIINDVRALQKKNALKVAAQTNVAICLMHMQGTPENMQDSPDYRDVLKEVGDFLDGRIKVCVEHGIDRSRLLLDPGFGFGKTLEHNQRLLKELAGLSRFKLPVLAGLSRKSMVGTLTNRPVDSRVYGSIAAALVAVKNGANILRVHDVAATNDALKVWQAVA